MGLSYNSEKVKMIRGQKEMAREERGARLTTYVAKNEEKMTTGNKR